MAAQLTEIKDLDRKQPLFKEFCKINGLKNGDYYKAYEFISWCDNLTLIEGLAIMRKYTPNFKMEGCNL